MRYRDQKANVSDNKQDIKEALNDIFGSEASVIRYAPDILRSVDRYRYDKQVGLKTRQRTKKLQAMLNLCDNLLSEIGDNRKWLSLNLDIDTSPVLGVEELVNGGRQSSLFEFRHLLADSIETLPAHNGNEKVYIRRRLWIWLSYIYEDATGKRVATSKNKDGQITGNFVRYILLISHQFRELRDTTPDMVDQFVDWYRGDNSRKDREEVLETRQFAAAVG